MSETADRLGFSDQWFALGLVTESRHQELLSEYRLGIDPNPEHYRWRAFQEFMQKTHGPSESLLRDLYRLGELDPDHAMGSSIITEVVRRSDCPVDLLNKAARDVGRKHLLAIVKGRL